MRHIWEKYYDDAECIVFIVDSCDRERLEEAKLAYGKIDSTLLLYFPHQLIGLIFLLC